MIFFNSSACFSKRLKHVYDSMILLKLNMLFPFDGYIMNILHARISFIKNDLSKIASNSYQY